MHYTINQSINQSIKFCMHGNQSIKFCMHGNQSINFCVHGNQSINFCMHCGGEDYYCTRHSRYECRSRCKLNQIYKKMSNACPNVNKQQLGKPLLAFLSLNIIMQLFETDTLSSHAISKKYVNQTFFPVPSIRCMMLGYEYDRHLHVLTA